MPSTRWFRGGRGATIALATLVAVLALGSLAGVAAAKKLTKQVEIVSQAGPPEGPIPANTHYFTTIQAAVNATEKNAGDWVLIEPGIFDLWRNLVSGGDVKGKTAHDARLVAAMQHHLAADVQRQGFCTFRHD